MRVLLKNEKTTIQYARKSKSRGPFLKRVSRPSSPQATGHGTKMKVEKGLASLYEGRKVLQAAQSEKMLARTANESAGLVRNWRNSGPRCGSTGLRASSWGVLRREMRGRADWAA